VGTGEGHKPRPMSLVNTEPGKKRTYPLFMNRKVFLSPETKNGKGGGRRKAGISKKKKGAGGKKVALMAWTGGTENWVGMGRLGEPYCQKGPKRIKQGGQGKTGEKRRITRETGEKKKGSLVRV